MQYMFPYHINPEIYTPYMSKLLIKIPAGESSTALTHGFSYIRTVSEPHSTVQGY